jgi:hypothetical protein
MAEYVYIGARMNVSLSPVFRNVQEVDNVSGGNVMMWAAISNDCKIDLVLVTGEITAVRYRDEIIQPHLMHVID